VENSLLSTLVVFFVSISDKSAFSDSDLEIVKPFWIDSADQSGGLYHQEIIGDRTLVAIRQTLALIPFLTQSVHLDERLQ
jgi:hypothetical protein